MADTKNTRSGSAGANKSGANNGGQKNRNGSGSGSRPRTTNSGTPVKVAGVGSVVKDEIFSIIIIVIGAFLILALMTSTAGKFGENVSDFLMGLFGHMAYVLPFYLIIYGLLLFLRKMTHISKRSFLLLVLIFIFICIAYSTALYIKAGSVVTAFSEWKNLYASGVMLKNGGFIGMFIGGLLVNAMGKGGTLLLSFAAIIILLLLIVNTPIHQFIENRKIDRAVDAANRAEEEQIRIKEAQAAEAAKKEAERKKFEEDRRRLDEERKRFEEERKKAAEAAKKGEDPAVSAPESILSGVHPGGIVGAAKEAAVTAPPGAGYVPGKMSSGQRNIMDLMNDDELFTDAPKQAGYGLDGTGMSPEEAAALEAAGEQLGMTGVSAGEAAAGIAAGAAAAAGASGTSAGTAGTAASGVSGAGGSANAGAASSGTTEGSGTTRKPVKTLTNKEAAEAMLSDDELNKTKVPQYVYPPVDLLKKSPAAKNSYAQENMLRNKAAKLEETLRSFNVDARVINVTKGPAVTRYEIQPAVGVKVSSIVRLADDIALNLEAKSIRIEAPIPGKAAVGIEIENDAVNMVTLRDIVASEEFRDSKSKITFAVGKDIPGNNIVADLKGMPHLLIAGSTGSGKSVCINSIILSLLYKASPDEVKLLLIDPKVVELGNYNGIPHLLIPVVTDPSKAAAALNWAVAEMMDRYKKFEEESVKDLKSYNECVTAKGEADKFMPQIVIIIDELADLMMAAPSQVEESIQRLTQMARAAGMHLIVATQRPSVDVITGVIKANIPSRIAFAVSSQVDSRTIIDMAGAEKLVGKGDMLFHPQGSGKPLRVQGTFVSDEEVHSVIEFVKSRNGGAQTYSDDIKQAIEKVGTAGSQGSADDDGDELLPEAIDMVVHAGQASVSMLQRRFRIGYNRAARIVDMMEARGIVGPQDGARPRQVLMTETELYGMQHGVDNDNGVEIEIPEGVPDEI